MTTPRWRIGVDVGGTFADCVGLSPSGERRRLKLLTDGRLRSRAEGDAAAVQLAAVPAWAAPALAGMEAIDAAGRAVQVIAAAWDGARCMARLSAAAEGWLDLRTGEEAPVLAARLLTGTPPGRPLPAMDLRVGTTRGTNALLEGRGDRVAGFVNEGLEGLFAIGTQQRLGLFDRVPRLPPRVVQDTFPVRARRAADGSVVTPFDEPAVRTAARRAFDAGFRAAAVALLHAVQAPEDERRVAVILREEGFERVALGSDVARVPELLPRAQTAAVDAALGTAVRGLLERIAAALPGTRVHAATSAGNVVALAGYRPKDSLLSGPAMGCAAARASLAAAGITRAITFDMGGTSTDVARVDGGEIALRGASTVAGITVATPSVDVHSVAAGGGSICRATRQGLFVGPASAGADPGPACYGRGGPLTVTDVNLLLGRLPADLPGLPIDRAAAQAAAEREAAAGDRDVEPMLREFLALANEHMAAAVRAVTVIEGHDPRTFALAVFGGAGGQHGCAVADALGITQVVVLPHAGFVSGEGALSAPSQASTEEPPAADLAAAGTGADAPARTAIRQGPESIGSSEAGALHPAPSASVVGPALILETGATVCVEDGWEARPDPSGALLLRRTRPAAIDAALPTDVVAARCTAIATWMAAILQRSARSVNVRDRLDFSCGILSAEGLLCANAPNVPVHLGALGACVRTVLAGREIAADECILVNHPAFGGSHLPDLTVLRPVHDASGRRIAFVAARAHHAEIGGIRPGSMPPDARTLEEEGVTIAPMTVARGGVLDERALRRTLAAARWPSRDPDLNVADVRAALAALDAGAVALAELASAIGSDALARAIAALLSRSAARTQAIASLVPAAGLARTERLDDGTPITVRIDRSGDGLRIDFAGTGGVHPANLNAPLAVTRSAVLYALRMAAGTMEALDEHRAPLNEGFLQPVELHVPAGILNPPFGADPAQCPPVFAGNTETSQRTVDALLGALGIAAASQGTMNNLVIAGHGFGMFETIGGGAGAAPGAAGADAVHVHMTNTRLTDPETLEVRTPLRVERLQVRHGTGGAGAAPGGNGMVRRIRALAACEACFVAERRASAPEGLAGGSPGTPGAQRILRADGTSEPLDGRSTSSLAAGDAIEIETPGGGGHGVPHVSGR